MDRLCWGGLYCHGHQVAPFEKGVFPVKKKKTKKSVPPPKSHKHFASAKAVASPNPGSVEKNLSPDQPARLIDKAELLKRIPVTFPTIWAWIRAGNFPRSKNIGGKTAWIEAEVQAWIEARPDKVFKDDLTAPRWTP
jgi:predicted DNA-binding transcriptional regulator AlpA